MKTDGAVSLCTKVNKTAAATTTATTNRNRNHYTTVAAYNCSLYLNKQEKQLRKWKKHLEARERTAVARYK